MSNLAHICKLVLLQLADKVFALLPCLFVQLVLQHEPDCGTAGGADQRITSKRAAVLSYRWLHLLRADRRAHGKPTRDGLGHAEDVRLQAEMIAGEHSAGPAKARLYFIDDE